MMSISGNHILNNPIEYLKGVGPQRADVLKKELGIFTWGDLLLHYPFRYVDRSKFSKISDILQRTRQENPDSSFIQLKGKITDFETIGERRGKRLAVLFSDGTGVIELIWFQGINWISKTIVPNKEYVVFGRPNFFKGKLSMPHPEIEAVEGEETGISPLQPMYNSTEKMKAKGLHSRGIMKLQKTLLSQITKNDLPENLPLSVLDKLKLTPRFESLTNIHFPKDEAVLLKAQTRLKFEELFFIQVELLKIKSDRKHFIQGFIFQNLDKYFNPFYKEKMPFELTEAQKRVLKEIRQDLISGKQMNRLLQGDVGSGKTMVALMTMLMALDNGFQACLMAPTEILAQQHFHGIADLLKEMEVKVALLTGSAKGSDRREILEKLGNGEIHMLIGTHALIEDTVQFKSLGLVVIDEQHRFGVEQRAKLWTKNQLSPHILVMTATPIPRTLAMTLYGDLDISVIDEMPPGRRAVMTVHRTDSSRLRVFGFLKEQIAKGRQVYVVYPLIQESETLDYKDLMDGYESIVREFPAPQYQVSIVHGKMKSEDKEWEMHRFVKGETNIMVATNVIEVGVNVPNATVMVIESAERFGLSQLHQLRGRVGRGGEQSYCILMTGNKLSNEARHRMQTMASTNDGFEIAEVDLKLRGPGDLQGTQQSGILNLRIADIAKDEKILKAARNEAADLLNDDPALEKAGNANLKKFLLSRSRERGKWSRIS